METYFDDYLELSSRQYLNENENPSDSEADDPDITQEIIFIEEPQQSEEEGTQESEIMSNPPAKTLKSGIVLNAVPCTIDKALTLGGATYTRQQRETITSDQRSKFVKNATTPTFSKFSIIDFTKGDSEKFLQENFSFMSQVESLRRHLLSYGLLEVFYLEDIDDDTKDADDILKSYATLTLEQVQAWVEYLNTWGDQVTLENLHLSLLLLLNACDEELQAKVHEEVSAMEPKYQNGPVAFMVIARNIVVTTEKTIRTFTYHLQQVRLNKIPGEDVGKFIAIFKGAANRLEAAKQLPLDARLLAYNGLRSTSVP